MELDFLPTLFAAIVLGTASYTLARKIKIPAILFYLLLGMLFGPVGLGLLKPELLGRGLPGLVELAVPIILFEGGISLPAKGFRVAPAAIRRILLVGLPVTGVGATLAAHWLIGMSWSISALFGAIIVVTGPTVIGPLLRSMTLSHQVEVLLRYEGIWGDCIGVLLSAVAIEVLVAGHGPGAGALGVELFSRVMVGIVLGVGSAFILARIVLPWVEKLGDPSLPGTIALAASVGIFWQANSLLGSSGVVAVAVAGFTLSALKPRGLKEIKHFKDQVAMVFISTLFVLLSASIDPRPTWHLVPRMILVAMLLGVVVRPLGVYFGLSGTCISRSERLYVGLVGPRGIIAMATASYAAFLVVGREQEMTVLLTLTFVVIFLSGTIASLFGRLFAKALGVMIDEYEAGIVFVGVNRLSQEIARHASQRVPVRFIDPSTQACQEAAGQGFESDVGTALDDDLYDEVAEEGFRRAVVMTPNDALNVLIVKHAQHHFGVHRAFRAIAMAGPDRPLGDEGERAIAFSKDFSFLEASKLLKRGRAKMELRPAGDIDDRRVFGLLEMTDKGVKIVRAGRRPQRETLCLVSDSDMMPRAQTHLPGVSGVDAAQCPSLS